MRRIYGKIRSPSLGCSHVQLSSTDAAQRVRVLVVAIHPDWFTVAVKRLDLRDLPAPEPMQRALQAAEALEPGQALEVLTPLLPAPLLEALDARGLHWRSEPCADHGTRVAILSPAA